MNIDTSIQSCFYKEYDFYESIAKNNNGSLEFICINDEGFFWNKLSSQDEFINLIYKAPFEMIKAENLDSILPKVKETFGEEASKETERLTKLWYIRHKERGNPTFKRSELLNACYNPSHFLIIKEYINFRLSVSGMGKFYLEYPPKKTTKQFNEMQVPEDLNVIFDINFSTTENVISISNNRKTYLIGFNNYLISPEKYTVKEIKIIDEVFCYLLTLAIQNKN